MANPIIIQLNEIKTLLGVFTCSSPVVITPEFHHDTRLFMATIHDLNFVLTGFTLDGLLQDLAEQVDFVWRKYALADEGDLTEDAQQYRSLLLQRFTKK